MCAHILLVLMSAVNQPHVSPARSQKEPRGTKPIVSQESFDLHSSKQRMLLSRDLGIADTGCDPIYAHRLLIGRQRTSRGHSSSTGNNSISVQRIDVWNGTGCCQSSSCSETLPWLPDLPSPPCRPKARRGQERCINHRIGRP